MTIPQPPQMAKLLLQALGNGGGSVSLAALEGSLGRDAKIRIDGVSSDREVELLRETLRSAVSILVRNNSASVEGDRLILNDQGFEQSRAVSGAEGSATTERSERHGAALRVEIDMSDAEEIIEIARQNGTVIRGYLRSDARDYHRKLFVPPASDLLNELYRAEIDGRPVATGFYTTARDAGVFASAVELLESKCHIRLIGLEREGRGARGAPMRHSGRGGRPGRKATWERLICEVIDELGGHAEPNAIFDVIGERPAAQEYVNWRSECMQALRNHTVPAVRAYFEVAELHGRRTYALTDSGRRLAARRLDDERAPTLAKLMARAVSHDGDDKLTEYELYALLHLAVELGKPNEARAIYHRLPVDFPDEERYNLAPLLFQRAEYLREKGSP